MKQRYDKGWGMGYQRGHEGMGGVGRGVGTCDYIKCPKGDVIARVSRPPAESGLTF